MINTLEELSEYIDTIDTGQPIYNISQRYEDEIKLELSNWDAIDKIKSSDYWLHKVISRFISRKYSILEKKNIIKNKDSCIEDIIYDMLGHRMRDILYRVSPAEKPKRTNFYKNFIELSIKSRKNKDFINDIIPIMNYYYANVKGQEDNQVHTKNVFALLNLLGKKYAKSSN